MKNTNTILKQISNLKKEIQYLEKLIAAAPEGRLVARKLPSGKYRYSLKEPSGENDICQEKYLNADEMNIATALSLKEYASHRISDAKQEMRLLQMDLNLLTGESNVDRFFDFHPGKAQLVKPFIRSIPEQLSAWKSSHYAKNQNHPEGLIYSTIIPELMVRSKAEADIIGRFEHFGVPYHYEEELRCGHTVIHPDFTCRNLSTGKIIYWEHQGRWDDIEYVHKLSERNALYCQMGIYPCDNLIITAETAGRPLDII